jgi:hypothetical protein
VKHVRVPASSAAEGLATTVDEALELLDEFSPAAENALLRNETPSNLLDQCLELCTEYRGIPTEPIRMLHHLACSGGTLISKCIAAMPNTQLVSEVDPLSTLQDRQRPGPRFAPTDMIQLLRQSTRGAGDKLLIDVFLGDLERVRADAATAGQRLVLRDHAHSHFCSGPDVPVRPTLRDMVASRFPVRSLVTVRHPIDSFLAVKANRFVHFEPQTFDEYCKRHLAFLDAHEGVPLVRYEDFVEEPQEVMHRMCDLLELSFSDQFLDLFGIFKLTGDSGRSGEVIETRDRRPVDAATAEAVASSGTYQMLRDRLGYE